MFVLPKYVLKQKYDMEIIVINYKNLSLCFVSLRKELKL